VVDLVTLGDLLPVVSVAPGDAVGVDLSPGLGTFAEPGVPGAVSREEQPAFAAASASSRDATVERGRQTGEGSGRADLLKALPVSW
jgi:hypothetical protein